VASKCAKRIQGKVYIRKILTSNRRFVILVKRLKNEADRIRMYSFPFTWCGIIWNKNLGLHNVYDVNGLSIMSMTMSRGSASHR